MVSEQQIYNRADHRHHRTDRRDSQCPIIVFCICFFLAANLLTRFDRVSELDKLYHQAVRRLAVATYDHRDIIEVSFDLLEFSENEFVSVVYRHVVALLVDP